MVINSCSINKLLFFKRQRVALAVSTKPLVTQRALCSDGAHVPVVSRQALGSLCLEVPALLGGEGCLGGRSGNTFTRCGICCWDWGGSPPGEEQGPMEQAGSDNGLWVSYRMFRNVCLSCCLVLSCIASSKVDSAGEESGVQLQVELLRNLS